MKEARLEVCTSLFKVEACEKFEIFELMYVLRLKFIRVSSFEPKSAVERRKPRQLRRTRWQFHMQNVSSAHSYLWWKKCKHFSHLSINIRTEYLDWLNSITLPLLLTRLSTVLLGKMVSIWIQNSIPTSCSILKQNISIFYLKCKWNESNSWESWTLKNVFIMSFGSRLWLSVLVCCVCRLNLRESKRLWKI